MNFLRAQSVLSSQSRLAQKVFAAVPMQSFWDVQQISTEMFRLENHNLSKAEITGCLRTLAEAGLINETASLTFRSNVKPPKDTPVIASAVKNVKAPKQSFMEQLFAVATTLRTAAEQVETLAMEVDTAIVDAGKGNEKLKQLQTTLRGLMGEEA